MQAVEADGTFELAHKAEPGAGAARRRRPPARRRALGLRDDPRARALAGDHAQHLRRRGARRPVPRPDQRGEQPPLRRADRGDEPLRRNPHPRPRLLLPRIDQPHPLRDAIPSGRMRASTARASPRRWRSRSACSTTCLSATVWPLPEQAREAESKRRVGLGFTGLGDALIMLGLRYDSDAARALAARPDPGDARRRLPRQRRPRPREGRVSLVRGGGVPRLRQRPAAARRPARRDPRARAAQQPPAVDRTDRDDQPRLRRQRIERDRARLCLVLHPAQARAGRVDARVPGRGPRLAALAGARRQCGRAAAGLRQCARDRRARPHEDAGGDPALYRRRDLEDGQRARGLPVRGLRVALSRGLARRAQGHHHLPPEQRARRRALGRAATRRRTSTSPSPTGGSASPTRRRWRWRRCAGRTGRSSPPARRPGPTWSRRRGTASPSSSATSRTAGAIRSRSG